MSLEEFLEDLGNVSEMHHRNIEDKTHFESTLLAKFDRFLPKQENNAVEEAANLAGDFHGEIIELAEIFRSRLTKMVPEFVSLFPKNSEFVKAVVNLKMQRPCEDWLDRPRQLAMSTSLATIDHSVLAKTLDDLEKTINTAERIQDAQQILTEFLSATVVQVAPALTTLLEDAELVARLIIAAGSLQRLASIPSANIVHIGKEHVARRQGGQGILSSSHLVTTAPISDQAKILKTLANKAGLAARMDAFRTSEPATGGGEAACQILKMAMERRLKTTPLQPRTVKPLPVPTTKEKTHRAGKRIRKKKEQIRTRVVASRMKFGVEENLGQI